MVAMVVTALLFDPVRKWIQEKLDQYFFRTGYDYRRTLIEFGRELSSETDLDKMLSSLVDRLARTLLVDRIAIFLGNSDSSRFELSKSFGIAHVTGLDLSFLAKPRIEDAAGHIFFENTHQLPRENALAQEAIGRLDLNYYIPCHARQKTIAFLGLGKTMEGDFLSSEDVELLEALAGYIGIAIQNGAPLRLTRTKGQRIRAAQGLQREHRRVDQRRRDGGGSARPDRILELADGSHVRPAALAGGGAILERGFSGGLRRGVLSGSAKSWDSQSLQIPLGDAYGRIAHRECRDRAARHAQIQRRWPAGHHGRHHRAHRPRSPADARPTNFLRSGCWRRAWPMKSILRWR